MTAPSGPLGPLLFRPILKEKVWGSTRLARYGKALEPNRLYGESWELADLPTTSAGGGGGGEARSVVAAGSLTGTDINSLVRTMGDDLLGDARAHVWDVPESEGGGPAFPLLVKLLDAGEHLSVQVHPSPAYARAHPGAHLKTESWVVLEAERAALPNGTPVDPSVYAGIEPGTPPGAFREAAVSGAVEPMLVRRAARVGECHTLPSGTCHALGAGVLVAEVQTPSDTTFRVYDWAHEYGRVGRELHLDEAIECIDFEIAARPEPTAAPPSGVGEVARTDRYTIESVRLEPGGGADLGGDRCAIVMLAEGEAVCAAGGVERPLPRGATALVAACECDGASVRSGSGAWALVVRPG